MLLQIWKKLSGTLQNAFEAVPPQLEKERFFFRNQYKI